MNATTPAAGEQSEDDSEDIETKIADPRRADPGSSAQWRHIGSLVSTIPRERSDHSQAPVTLPSKCEDSRPNTRAQRAYWFQNYNWLWLP
jgi:hypothetical protein